MLCPRGTSHICSGWYASRGWCPAQENDWLSPDEFRLAALFEKMDNRTTPRRPPENVSHAGRCGPERGIRSK